MAILDEIIIEESAFDLEREYQVYIEGVNKKARKAAKKAGVELDDAVFKGITGVARHIKKKSIGFEALGDNSKEKAKFHKKRATAYIKAQIYKLSSNPEYQAKAEKQQAKKDIMDKEYEVAKKKNKEKIERRGGQLAGNVPNPHNLSKKVLTQKLDKHTGKEKDDNKQKVKLVKKENKLNDAMAQAG